MIVKDEVDVLGPCLESCRDLIDYWVICDTGSTDGTQELIRRELDGIPGELHQHPWVDFGHNRTELMKLARGRAEYLLILDADTTLEADPRALENLTADAYLLRHTDAIQYHTKRLVSGRLEWRYVGVAHEYIVCDQERATERLDEVTIRSWSVGGARKGRWQRDAEVLEAEVKRVPTDERSMFYLAQTYRDMGLQNDDPETLALAVDRYERRTHMGGWVEETYYAWHQVGVLSAHLGDWPKAADAFITAWETRPVRLEAVHDLAVGLLERKHYHAAHQFTRLASGMRPLPMPDDLLFVTPWIYEWGLLFQYSISAYWRGEYDVAISACKRLLGMEALPDSHRRQTQRNMQYAVRERTREAAQQMRSGRKWTHAGHPTRGRATTRDFTPPQLRDPELAERLATLCGLSERDVEQRLLSPGAPIDVYVEPLEPWPLRIRPGTSDLRVLDEAYSGLDHLPAEELAEPQVIVDLGAHIGATAAHLGHLYPSALIVAVELDRSNAELCAHNLAPLEHRVTVVTAAIAPQDGSVCYGTSDDHAAHRAQESGDASVVALSLDTLLDRTAHGMVVDYMKVDIPGSEGQVIRVGGRWSTRVSSIKVALYDDYAFARAEEDLSTLGFKTERTEGLGLWIAGMRSDARVRAGGRLRGLGRTG
jgi:FkbM family methyltransferase